MMISTNKKESNPKLNLTLTPNTNPKQYPTPNHNPNSKKQTLNPKINS
jgi:hypothetical protein